LSEIAAKPVNDDISSSDYRSRIDALNRIKRGLNALPDDYDTAAYFEQCGSLHGVFEKSYNDRKYKELPNELSEIAAKPVNDDISSYEYRSRITALDQIKSGLTSLSGAYDTAAYIKKCDSLHGMFEKGLAAAQTREEKKEARRRAKMRRAKSAKSAGRVILGGLIGAASGGAAIFLLSVLVGGGDNVLVGVLLVIVGLISGGIVSHLIFDDSGCLTFFIGPIIGALIFGAVIFQGIPFIRYSIAASVSISSICAIGAAIGALIGSIVAGKT
jgi:hypothetical protein